jgi:UDP-N-acetylglucosamine 2-epimerase (non-hydrolysing)/UDP-GlcNAc3NAcA epimerase
MSSNDGMQTILTVVGARPQFVKSAMVADAFRRAQHAGTTSGAGVREVLVHTGQHYDAEMSDIFFRELRLPAPRYHLGVGSGLHGQQTGRMLEALEAVILKERPDAVLVYGDTNSTLAGALAASKLHVPIAHVEAGLRSHNRLMPEETNRVVADHVATWLYCPTPSAVANLKQEGITRGVSLVGDVMAEASRACRSLARQHGDLLRRWELAQRGYYLATVHRAENTDDKERLTGILDAMAALDLPVIFPCHPRTRQRMDDFGLQAMLRDTVVRLVEPVGYFDMLALEADARMILTDSGGVQKEALWAGVPCVTLRDETEWVETVDSGWNMLAGTRCEDILNAVRSFRPPSQRPEDDSDAEFSRPSDLIVTHLLKELSQAKLSGIPAMFRKRCA